MSEGTSSAQGENGRELAGSVALVTGGAVGIGRAICTGLRGRRGEGRRRRPVGPLRHVADG